MVPKTNRTGRTRSRWIIVGGLLVLACLLAAASAFLYLLHNVPGIARLVYGEPASPTVVIAVPAIRTATLTALPSPVAQATQEPEASTKTPPAAIQTPVVAASPSPVTGATQEPEALTKTPPAAIQTPVVTASPSPVTGATQEPRAPTQTPLPAAPTPQWLAFETDRGSLGDYEIFVIATDGSRMTNLTSSWADDVAPVWSPTGRRIAFVSYRDTPLGKWSLGPGSIYLLGFDPATGTAGNLFRLTDGTSDDGWATWSPDGTRIAFQSDHSGDLDIWVVQADGTGRTRLTDSPGEDEHPAWSPDGTRIAFTSDREGNRDVWVMQADGADPVNLTRSTRRDRYPRWSPDGTRIAFNTNRDGDQEIYVMSADGSNQTNVSRSPESTEGLADWSPEGDRLVLYSDLSGHKDLYILNLVTGQWIPVTDDPITDEFCTWSP